MEGWIEESTTYQDIVRQGQKRSLFRIAFRAFGSPSPDHLKRFERCDDQTEVDVVSGHLPNVASWDEFLEGI